jgi:hypothetical protein
MLPNDHDTLYLGSRTKDVVRDVQEAKHGKEIHQLRIVGLDIQKDLFDKLLDLMSTRKPWKHVALSSCSGQGVPMLLQAILELDCTERLTFGTHYPESRAADFLALAHGLPHTRLLSSLDLGLGILTPAGALALAASISKCTKIRELNLGMLRIETARTSDDTHSLSTPSRLRGALAHAMRGTSGTHDNTLVPAGLQIPVSALAKAIVHNSNITKLKFLCHNNPRHSLLQLKVLEELSVRSSPLDELKLGWFPPSAIQRTLKILQSNKLRGIDVSCVRSQDMKLEQQQQQQQQRGDTELTLDVLSVTKILDINTSLKRLNLSVNNISDDELLEILTKLRHNSTLEELDLSYNKITDQGACLIAEALPQLTGLKRLMLKGNDIAGNVGCESLLANMKGNMQIELLELEPTLKGSSEIALVTQWNRGGRRILKDDNFLPSLWPLVLGRVNRIMCVSDGALSVDGRPEVLYYFLRQGPVLFQQR